VILCVNNVAVSLAPQLFIECAFCEQCLEAWEEVIPKIQRTDATSDDVLRTSPKSECIRT